MPFQWMAEHIYNLSLDETSRRITRRMAVPEKWLTFGGTSGILWGEFPVKNKPSIQTTVRLTNPAFSCSCRSRRFPCEHATSLLLMWVETPSVFDALEAPDWAQTALVHIPDFTPAPSRTREKESDSRQAALVRGLEELELWLLDLARSGLADVPQRPKASWMPIAQRLIDAGASEVAREVQRIATIPASGDDWEERLLGELGLLYLLIQGVKRLDSLPPESQADLRIAVGWLPHHNLSRTDLCVRDRWHVLSNQVMAEARQHVQRTWLWGQNHNRAALIVQRSYRAAELDMRLLAGTLADAEVCYFPASIPIRAQVTALYAHTHPDIPPAGCASINEAVAAYSTAISRNAWIGAFPVMLRGVVAATNGGQWILSDPSGALPLIPDHPQRWHLRALTRNGDVPVFAEWDGAVLQPLSVWAGDRWIELRTLPGIK